MSLDSDKNNVIFDVLLRSADSYGHLSKAIDDISQISNTLNESHMSNLVEYANDVISTLEETTFSSQAYRDLLEECPKLEPIIYLNRNLTEYIADSNRTDDAITLLELAEYLHKSYQLPVIESIYRQALKQREYLRSNLFKQLSALKDSSDDKLRLIVSQLAKCGDFSDRELKLRYLQARDGWFNNECDARSESFDELISFFCRGLPKIFDEYKNIFDNADALPICQSASANETAKEDGAIINSWLLLKASTFILSLEMHLKSVGKSKSLNPTIISDIMLKCFKLTNWLASIGFDFSSQLWPIFSRAIVEEVRFAIDKATNRFETSFTKIISVSIESLLLHVDDEILRISHTKLEEQVPKSIEHYPVFRIYCLYLIDSFRWIQTAKNIVPITSLCLDTYAAFNSSLTRVMKALAIALNTDNNSGHPILSKIAISFLTEVLPFFSNYCELMFPEKVILGALGMPKTEFKHILATETDSVKNFRLDLRRIADPLRCTMPALMQTIES